MAGVFVKQNDEWNRVSTPHVNVEDVWYPCKAVYVNVEGVWWMTYGRVAEIIKFPQRPVIQGEIQDVCVSAA